MLIVRSIIAKVLQGKPVRIHRRGKKAGYVSCSGLDHIRLRVRPHIGTTHLYVRHSSDAGCSQSGICKVNLGALLEF
jgi:hypothetical protein